jgi:hypothetical protein
MDAPAITAPTRKKPRISQRTLYIALNAILAAAILIFFTLYFITREDNPNPPPTHYVYDFPRNPHLSSNPDIAWELNIGGSGEDILGAVYFFGGSFYMIGTTTSRDLDFTHAEESGQNLFLAVADRDGRIYYTKIFGSGGNDNFVRARLWRDGFLVLANTDKGNTKYILYYLTLGTFGITVREYDSLLNIEAVDLHASSAGIAIVAYNHDKLLQKGSFIVTILDTNLNLRETFTLNRAASMSYRGFFPTAGGYILVAESTETLSTFATLITLAHGAQPVYHDFRRAEPYGVSAAAPDDKGGFIILTNGANPSLLLINNARILQKVESLGFPQTPADGSLIRSGNGLIAICRYENNSKAAHFSYDLSLISAEIESLSNLGRIAEAVETSENTVILSETIEGGTGNSGGKVFVTVINSQTSAFISQKSFTSNGAIFPVSIFADENITAFCISYAKGGDIKHNFGQADIWYFRLA